MIRYVLAAMTALVLAACQPALKIDQEDPWKSLHPWHHNWKEIQKVEVTGEGSVTGLGNGKEFQARVPGMDGSWLTGGTLKWTSGPNEGQTAKVISHADGEVVLSAAPKSPIQLGDKFNGTAGVAAEFVIIRKGDGKGGFPAEIDQVEVNYDGRFAKSGETFDSSYERGETSTFGLNGVIKGWTKGLQKMQPGDMYMFWIPWQLAYGEQGRGPIESKADLMFQVELLNVIPAVSADPRAWAKVTPWPTASSDVVRKPSGLEYLIVDSGDENGASPTDRDFVNLHVEGRLEDEDHSIVLSTYEDQQTVRFPVADLTPGWAELMRLMRPGDHWMVRMPPHLMYKDEGDGRVPPNATVVYEVRLESVIVIDPPPPESAQPDKPK